MDDEDFQEELVIVSGSNKPTSNMTPEERMAAAQKLQKEIRAK